MAKIKGICHNVDGCDMAADKIVQEREKSDFVCEECGKPLYPLDEKKKGKSSNKMPFIIIAIVIVLAIIAGCALMFLGGSEDQKSEAIADTIDTVVKNVPETTTKSDTVVIRDTLVKHDTTTIIESTKTKTVVNTSHRAVAKDGASKTAVSGKSSLNLSYGKYVGEVKGGYPNGMGRLTYKKERQINRYDSKGRTASPGDYVIGEFVNGFFVQGKHYNANNELIESLIIGAAGEDVYESK